MRDLHVSHDSEIRSLIVVCLEKTSRRFHAAQIWKAHDGIRTRDLFLTKEVLYRLSYMGPETFSIIRGYLERETGLEPATPSLEGSRSTN